MSRSHRNLIRRLRDARLGVAITRQVSRRLLGLVGPGIDLANATTGSASAATVDVLRSLRRAIWATRSLAEDASSVNSTSSLVAKYRKNVAADTPAATAIWSTVVASKPCRSNSSRAASAISVKVRARLRSRSPSGRLPDIQPPGDLRLTLKSRVAVLGSEIACVQ